MDIARVYRFLKSDIKAAYVASSTRASSLPAQRMFQMLVVLLGGPWELKQGVTFIVLEVITATLMLDLILGAMLTLLWNNDASTSVFTLEYNVLCSTLAVENEIEGI